MSGGDKLAHYMTACSGLKAKVQHLKDELTEAKEREEGLRDSLVESEKQRLRAIDDWDQRFREMEGLAKAFLRERDEAKAALAQAQTEVKRILEAHVGYYSEEMGRELMEAFSGVARAPSPEVVE